MSSGKGGDERKGQMPRRSQYGGRNAALSHNVMPNEAPNDNNTSKSYAFYCTLGAHQRARHSTFYSSCRTLPRRYIRLPLQCSLRRHITHQPLQSLHLSPPVHPHLLGDLHYLHLLLDSSSNNNNISSQNLMGIRATLPSSKGRLNHQSRQSSTTGFPRC